MLKSKRIKGISLIESLVCVVIIGIGFIAVLQLSAFSIGSMDRAMEKNKLNYLSEMVMEDMIGDPDNVSKYGNFIKTCSSGNQSASDLNTRMKKKWDDMLQQKNLMKIDNKDRIPSCDSYDTKKTFVNSGANTTGRVNFLTGKGKRKKYLVVVVK
jgi:Tfp pilus assembly protein PilV